jgi:hypothetical protein
VSADLLGRHTWRQKDSNSGLTYPCGGSGKRVTVCRTGEYTLLAGWSTTVSVAIGNGDSIATPAVNRYCQVIS